MLAALLCHRLALRWSGDGRGAILADVPADALVAVDGPFVIEFFLAHREAILAVPNTGPFDFRTLPYEYAVLGRLWQEPTAPRLEGLELVRSYGHHDDPFAPYAE